MILTSMPPKHPFQCGSYEGYQSDLCKKGEDQIKAQTDTTTPRTDAGSEGNYFSDSPRVTALIVELLKPSDGDRMDMTSLARQLERELIEANAEIERLKAANLEETKDRVRLDFENEKLKEDLAIADALIRQSDGVFRNEEVRAEKAEDEAARLQENASKYCSEHNRINDELLAENQKLEAEVARLEARNLAFSKIIDGAKEDIEKLESNLRRAVEIAEDVCDELLNPDDLERRSVQGISRAKLNAIKETLPETK
jgi:regulator of replication initiation timing